MLVDNGHFTGIADVVAENVTTMPIGPEDGRTVYLLQTDGAYVPGLYNFDSDSWTLLTNSDPVT